MTSYVTRARELVRRVVTLPIERIGDTGWLEISELRSFVEEAERLGLDGHNVRVWWTRGPEEEPPRLEVMSQETVAREDRPSFGDLPGMWEEADLIGGETDAQEGAAAETNDRPETTER